MATMSHLFLCQYVLIVIDISVIITDHKPLLSLGIWAHLHVAMTTVFCEFFVAMSTVSRRIIPFLNKSIKLHRHLLQSAKFYDFL